VALNALLVDRVALVCENSKNGAWNVTPELWGAPIVPAATTLTPRREHRRDWWSWALIAQVGQELLGAKSSLGLRCKTLPD